MELLGWFVQNWFTFIQSIGIIAGLLFTGAAFKRDAKSRQVVNLIYLPMPAADLLGVLSGFRGGLSFW
jgi:hypothetical protein